MNPIIINNNIPMINNNKSFHRDIINHNKPNNKPQKTSKKKHRKGEQPQKTTTYGDNDNKP